MTPPDLRPDLPALQRVVYMNGGTAGPLPSSVVEAMHASLDEDLRYGRLSPRRYEKMNDDRAALRSGLASLTGTGADSIVLTTGTVPGIALFFAARGPRPGTRTLVSSLEHPDALIPPLQRERDGGSRVEVVDIPDDATDAAIVEEFRARLAEGDPVDAILISHVSYATGRVLPVAQIVATVGPGVLAIVDGVQAVGAIPVDVTAIGADAYAFSAHKWLQGPEGVGAVAVRAEALGKLSHFGGLKTGASPRGPVIERADGPRSVEAIVPTKDAVRGALAALAWRASIGEEVIAAAMSRNTARIRAELESHPSVEVVTPADCAGLLSFRFRGLPAGRVSWELGQARVAVRDIPDAGLVRVSSGFYLDDGDIERFAEALRVVGELPEPEACPLPTNAGVR